MDNYNNSTDGKLKGMHADCIIVDDIKAHAEDIETHAMCLNYVRELNIPYSNAEKMIEEAKKVYKYLHGEE